MSNKTETNRYELKYPVTLGQETTKEITLKRPTVKDVMAANRAGGVPAEVELRMVSLLSGLSAEVIAELDMEDYTAVQSLLGKLVNTGTPKQG
jgi:hypothetical protein